VHYRIVSYAVLTIVLPANLTIGIYTTLGSIYM